LKPLKTHHNNNDSETKKKITTTTAAAATDTTTGHSRTQSVEEAAYYGALYGLMLNMDSSQPLLPPHPAPVLVDEEVKEAEEEEMMTIALLLDGALCDMVTVSTPRTGLDAAGEGVWQTVTRADSHHDLNLW
jgi:hypothetical protein